MTIAFSLSDDVINVSDMIERYEELETDLLACFNEQQSIENDDTETDDPEDSAFQEWVKVTIHEDASEFLMLFNTLQELKGCGGDEKWRGDWYPSILILNSHFQEYAQELAEDCGLTDKPVAWPYTCIDWEKAANELQYDYQSIDIDQFTYWYR
jgi:hypothetical protein